MRYYLTNFHNSDAHLLSTVSVVLYRNQATHYSHSCHCRMQQHWRLSRKFFAHYGYGICTLTNDRQSHLRSITGLDCSHALSNPRS